MQKDENMPVNDPQGSDEEMLGKLQRETFDYFLKEVDPVTGLVADKTQPGFLSSIAVVGMSLAVYIVGIENNFISREDAIKRTLKILRFFYNSKQGKEKKATGYKGFYYHFLKMDTGERQWNCELSTIDTALFIAGVLCAGSYFAGNDDHEIEIRKLSDELYKRIDWQWALNSGTTLSHGWKTNGGFLPYRWDKNYSEAHILYILALGSPTFPISPDAYRLWIGSFEVSKIYGMNYLYAGPMFIHQCSHMWIDFNGIMDAFNHKAGFDYYENSKTAAYIHRQYATENSNGYEHYGPNCWGLTASDGPGRITLQLNGKKRIFYDYIARGAPHGPDDGTVSPWAVVASLPFAPEIVCQRSGMPLKS